MNLLSFSFLAGTVNPGLIAFIVIAVIVVIAAVSNIYIVPQTSAFVVERLGTYLKVSRNGVHIKMPFIDRISRRINLMEQIADYPPQPVITKDNIIMKIDTVVFYQVTDCKLFAYGHRNPMLAIENLTSTTLRNIIGELELDNTLTSRDIINAKMRAILDEATDPWGIKVTRVELKSIEPPKEIQDAMEKQMRAERERRESILKAEGEKNSAILVAEGRKQSMILEAEAEKQAAILRAEAEKEVRIREAEGEAEAIIKIKEAEAAGIRMLNEAAPGKEVLTIKSLEALEKMADGKATKIIVPSELQSLAGLATGVAEAVKGVSDTQEK